MAYDGLGPAELAARLRARSCLSLIKVTSTLDVIHELASEGAPGGTIVLADEQVAGRGRLGRRWHSPPGAGIWLGCLARPTRQLENGVMALRVGLAVTESLEDLGVDARLKWPNDVVVRDRKLAGVLCESRWLGACVRWIAIGVGMNVHRPLPAEVSHTAIALEKVIPEVTRIAVLERLVPRLLALSDAPHLSEGERATYQRHDWLAGRDLVSPVSGRARGIDPGGALLIETSHGIERVAGGHVVPA